MSLIRNLGYVASAVALGIGYNNLHGERPEYHGATPLELFAIDDTAETPREIRIQNDQVVLQGSLLSLLGLAGLAVSLVATDTTERTRARELVALRN